MEHAEALELYKAGRKEQIEDFLLVVQLGQNCWFGRYGTHDDLLDGELAEPVKTFARGVHRLGNPCTLLAHSFVHGQNCQYISDLIRFQETGTLARPNMVYGKDEPGPTIDVLKVEGVIAQKAFTARRAIAQGGAFPPPGVSEGYSDRDIAEVVAGWNDEMRDNSLRGLYEALIILAWSTFEAVAEDLGKQQ